jgi:GntR family transcriptional repressor for pyruvate dehydrogenase complex
MEAWGKTVHSKDVRRALPAKVSSAFDTAVKVDCVADDIAQQLREQILNETISVGKRLPTEQMLGTQFGVSRNIVRDAIARLKEMGLVETRHGVGTFVKGDAEQTRAEASTDGLMALLPLMHLYHMRLELETGAAALAATHRSQTQLDQIRAALSALMRAGDEWEQASKATFDFHKVLTEATQNPFIISTHHHLASSTRDAIRTLRLRATDEQCIADILAEHEAIFQAIEMRDAKLARQAMRAHLERGMTRYRQMFGQI